MIKAAQLSSCGEYRYILSRDWQPELARAMFMGLNPSKANAEEDDPTVRRMIQFTKDWGYGGFSLVNLSARIATDPRDLPKFAFSADLENIKWINHAFTTTHMTVACWGTRGHFADWVMKAAGYRTMYCLGTTKHLQPKHPLYLRKDSKLEVYIAGEGRA